jgi:hypothetical protein
MRQKIFGLFFLTVWFIQNCFSFIFYQIERSECRQINFKVAQQKSINKKLLYFRFDNFDQIDWEVYGKEFAQNGVLYDVVAMSYIDNEVIIKCFKDKKESKILYRIKELHKSNTDGKNGNPSIKKMLCFNFFPMDDTNMQISYDQKEKEVFQLINAKAISAFQDIFKPPPQI